MPMRVAAKQQSSEGSVARDGITRTRTMASSDNGRNRVSMESPSARAVTPRDDAVHIHVGGKYCVSCKLLIKRSVETELEGHVDNTLPWEDISQDWEETVRELLIEYGIAPTRRKSLKDGRQIRPLDPVPTTRDLQARMSSAREPGVRAGYLAGKSPEEARGVLQEIARAREELRQEAAGAGQRAEGPEGGAPAVSQAQAARWVGQPPSAELQRELDAVDAAVREEARQLKRTLDMRGVFEPEMNEVRARTFQRIEHRTRLLRLGASESPGRPGTRAGARSAVTAEGQRRLDRDLGVLDRLEGLLRVVDAVESGRPVELVDTTNKETERNSNRARMAIQHTRVLLSMTAQETSAKGVKVDVPAGPMGQSMPTGPAIPAEDAVETAERARAQRLEKVKQQLQRVRDALEAEILQRFHEVVEMRGATGDGKGEGAEPVLREDYGRNGLDVLKKHGMLSDGEEGSLQAARNDSADPKTRDLRTFSGLNEDSMRGSTQDIVDLVMGYRQQGPGKLVVEPGELGSALSTFERPPEGFFKSITAEASRKKDVVADIIARKVRLDMERARAEHSTRAEPVPEDYEDLDTEGLLNASGKALLRSMEIMGDMTRLSSLANTAYDPARFMKRRDAAANESHLGRVSSRVPSSALANRPASRGGSQPGTTTPVPTAFTDARGASILGRGLGDVLLQSSPSPTPAAAAPLVYGPIPASPVPHSPSPLGPQHPAAKAGPSPAPESAPSPAPPTARGTPAPTAPALVQEDSGDWGGGMFGGAGAQGMAAAGPGAPGAGETMAAAETVGRGGVEDEWREGVADALAVEDPLGQLERSLATGMARSQRPTAATAEAPSTPGTAAQGGRRSPLRAADGGATARRLSTPPQSVYSALLHARLSRIWELLQMTPSQRAAMAVKYGESGSPWASRFEQAVMLWEAAASAMVERERALVEFASLTSHLARAAEGGGRPKLGTAAGMEDVCARLLYAHKLCHEIGDILGEVFGETFTLRGEPYPPPNERIHAEGLREVVAYARAICGEEDGAAEEAGLGPDPSFAAAMVGRDGVEGEEDGAPVAASWEVAEGGLLPLVAGAPPRRAEEVVGSLLGAGPDILRLSDRHSVEEPGSVSAALPPIGKRGVPSDASVAEEPSFLDPRTPSAEGSLPVVMSLALMQPGGEARAGQGGGRGGGAERLPWAQRRQQEAALRGRQPGSAGPDSEGVTRGAPAIATLEAGPSAAVEASTGHQGGRPPPSRESALSALSRQSMAGARLHTRLYDRHTRSRMLHRRGGVAQMDREAEERAVRAEMARPEVAAAVERFEARGPSLGLL